MAVVLISSAPSRDVYERVMGGLGLAEQPPPGLLAHTAGEVGGEIRIVDIWESPEALDAFAARVVPLVREAGAQGAGERFEAFDLFRAPQ